MSITNPQAIAFANQVVRPHAERLRALIAEIEAAKTAWYGGINALFPNDSTQVADGRDAEGISRLTGADVNNLMGVTIAVAASNAEIIAKPCVRPLTAS